MMQDIEKVLISEEELQAKIRELGTVLAEEYKDKNPIFLGILKGVVVFFADMIRAVDYCGIYTGAKVNKFEKCGLTPEPAHEVSCPLIAQSPLSLECRVTQVIPLGSHDMFLADILHVHVDESLLDKDGKLHLERAHLAAFAHGEYFELGKKIGKFGFSATKKKSHPPKKQHSPK